jgi:hypothetical protein
LSTSATGGSARIESDGGHDLELAGAELLDREVGFVLPRDQHVADAALDEGCGRTARAGVENGYIPVDIRDEFARLRFAAALLQY